ncbi:RHS repeat-associated core domain-containing protein [Fimbriimonas ginsengisoli]|nr:RHS repeat-associated core domain-containing protein [Fimbriimonas ginsengisoli]
MVNTNTGNRLTTIPIVNWPVRGAKLSMEFNLYHNSIGRASALGWPKSWRSSFDITVFEDSMASYTTDPPSTPVLKTAIVTWENGTSYKYTSWSRSPGVYTAPPGVYETLYRSTTGWKITRKDQIVYDFNNRGYLIDIKDRNGNTITVNHDPNTMMITSVVDPTGRTITFNQGNSTSYSSIVDPQYRTWTLTRNYSQNTLTALTYPPVDGVSYARRFTYRWDTNNPNAPILTETDLRGKVWPCDYDAAGRLTLFQDPLANQTNYTYNGSSTSFALPGGETYTHHYEQGVYVGETDPAGYSDQSTVDASRNVTYYRDKRGNNWQFQYGVNGNLTRTITPTDGIKDFGYNSTNDIIYYTDELNQSHTIAYQNGKPSKDTIDTSAEVVWTESIGSYGQTYQHGSGGHNDNFTFDSNGNILTANHDGYVETSSSDVLGNVTSCTNAAGETTSIAYDNWNRPITLTNPDNTTVTVSYDSESNVKSITDEKNHTTNFNYNDAMWRTSQTNAANVTESLGYNADGLLTSITNGRNFTRTFRYTPRGEFYSSLLADNSCEYAAYNASGAYSQRTNPLGDQIKYTYDSMGRLTKVDYPTGVDTTFGYGSYNTPHPPVKSMTDATGSHSWVYNYRGEVTQFVSPQGTINYTYDSLGRRVTMQEAGVGTTTYSYNTQQQLGSFVNAQGKTTTLLYDSAGRISRRTHSNGTYSTFAYDTRGRSSQIEHRKADNTVIRTEAYFYDAASNLSSKIAGGVQTTYGYDSLDRLTSENKTGYSASYTYDGNDNRLTRTVNGVVESYTYDGADKLLSITWPGSSKTFSYDLAGRTTQVSTPSTTTNLSYDYDDRLTYCSTYSTNFTYNGANARVGKSSTSVGTRTYKRNGVSPLSSLLSDGVKFYTPGVGDSSGQYYLGDRQGTYSLAVNGSQAKTFDAGYDAFGNLLSQTGVAPGPLTYAGGPGYQDDSEIGLKLLGNRYYDSGTGRFITRDPVGDGKNWYAYVSNNPLRYIDPSGFGMAGDLDDCAVELAAEASEAAAEEAATAGTETLAQRMGWQCYAWYIRQPVAVQRAVALIFALVEQTGKDAESGPAGGTMAHTSVANTLRATDFGSVTVKVEQSFIGKEPAKYYGQKGSVRCDVVLSYFDNVLAIFDHKFGAARLPESRIRAIKAELPVEYGNPPVFKVPGTSGLMIPR